MENTVNKFIQCQLLSHHFLKTISNVLMPTVQFKEKTKLFIITKLLLNQSTNITINTYNYLNVI